ncbi:MAG: hypothetical protein ACYTJ0_12710 [Planctomycetota bacterium]
MTSEARRTIVEGIDVLATMPFVRILRTVTVAMQPSCLVIGLLMVSALMTAGRAWDRLTEPAFAPSGLLAGPATDAHRETLDLVIRRVLVASGAATEESITVDTAIERLRAVHRDARAGLDGDQLAAVDDRFLRALRDLDDARPRGAFEATVVHCSTAFNRLVAGVLTLRAGDALAAAADLFARTPLALWRGQRTFVVVFGLLTVLVMALGGGTIARLTACQWAGIPRSRLGPAIDFAIARTGTFAAALILPLLMAGFAAAVVWVLGLLMRLPGLDLVGAVLYGPALVLGVVVALLLVGYLAGFCMLVPAVACERCDAADAQQRAFAYVLNRPLHLLGYGLVAVVGLAIGYLVVNVVLVLALNSVATLYELAGGSPPALGVAGGFGVLELTPRVAAVEPAGTGAIAADVITLWQTVLVSLAPAYVLAYFFAGSTLLYLLMRAASDGQDVTEIWTAEQAARRSAWRERDEG